MRWILGWAGICLIGCAAAVYFADVRTAVCGTASLIGIGLIVDAVRK
jgi:hypothetical protein